MMRAWFALLMMLMAPLVPASEKSDAAVSSGSQWLRKLDQAEYQAAYTGAGKLLRNKVEFEAWKGAVEKARTPLGMVHKRELIYGALEKQLSGIGPGEYAQLRFRTDFASKYEVIEHLTLMLEDDGLWRPIGYSVQ